MGWSGFWSAAWNPRVVASYKLTFGTVAHRGDDQRVLRFHRRLDAGSLHDSRQEVHRRADRPAVRPADGRLGHRADGRLLAKRLDRPVPRTARHQGGVLAAGHRDRADVHRPAVRRAHAAAGARRTRSRNGRSRRQPRRDSLQTFWRVILPAVLPALLDRLRAVVRPGARRIRLGGVHLRQHADEDRDHVAADHHEARTIRLRRRDGDRHGDARRLVRCCCSRSTCCSGGAARKYRGAV